MKYKIIEFSFLAFSADFVKILPSKTYGFLKMFLLSAQNNFYVILSSCEEEHVKKNSSLNFMKPFPGRTNSLKPPVFRFCDSLPFGLEDHEN